MLQWYDATDTSQLDGFPLGQLQRGETSPVVEIHLWSDKDAPTGQVIEDLLVVLCVEDPASPGTWIRSGAPPLDELWTEVRWIGQDAAADPTQQPWVTDWQPLGAYRGVAVPAIHSGCARYLEWRSRVPSSAQGTTWTWRMLVLASEHAVALPAGVIGRGVMTGSTDRALIRGGGVVPSDPVDGYVHILAREWLWKGELQVALAETVELTQQDAAGVYLGYGQSYWAGLTQGESAVSVTKGLEGEGKPELPGELLLAWVEVRGIGGLSGIEENDISGEPHYDRLLARPGTGLEVRVHPGEAIGGGTWRVWSRIASVPVPASSTSTIWQLASGLYEVAATAPAATALPLWEVETTASSVVSLRDRRTWAEERRVLVLRAEPENNSYESHFVSDAELLIERVILWISVSGGYSEFWRWDIRVNDLTIYPGYETDDQRPTIPSDAAERIHDSGYPEVRRLMYGDVISWLCVWPPGGGWPSRAELHLVCRAP